VRENQGLQVHHQLTRSARAIGAVAALAWLVASCARSEPPADRETLRQVVREELRALLAESSAPTAAPSPPAHAPAASALPPGPTGLTPAPVPTLASRFPALRSLATNESDGRILLVGSVTDEGGSGPIGLGLTRDDCADPSVPFTPVVTARAEQPERFEIDVHASLGRVHLCAYALEATERAVAGCGSDLAVVRYGRHADGPFDFSELAGGVVTLRTPLVLSAGPAYSFEAFLRNP
jgi:hypothetical protein